MLVLFVYSLLASELPWFELIIIKARLHISVLIKQLPFFQWFGVLYVLLYRFFIAVFCTCATIWSGFYYRHTGAKWFIYLTNWSFFCVTVYFICATIVTGVHYKNQLKQLVNTANDQKEIKNGVEMSAKNEDNKKSACEQGSNLVTTPGDGESEIGFTGYVLGASQDTPMRWFHQALWVIYNIAVVAAVLVTITFWSLIYASFGGGRSPISVIFHAVNSVVMVADTMLSSIPVRLFHFVYPMLYSITYISFTVIYWACGGISSHGNTYIYPQTDYSRPVFSAISLACLVLIALPLCHSLVFGLYCLRVWIKTKCLKKA